MVVKYCVVGSGVVGYATGRTLLRHGHEVHFVDTDPDVVARLEWREGMSAGTEVLPGFDGYFVAVSAPTTDIGFDATNLMCAARNVGFALAETDRFPVVVFRCTQPPGTTRNSLIPMLSQASGKVVNEGFGVVYWPEYLRAEHSLDDSFNPRQVTYSSPERHDDSGACALPLLLDFGSPVTWVELEAAEYQKYVHNVFNAIKISTFNWFRLLGEKIGLSEREVDDIIHLTVRSAEGLWNPEYGTRNLGPFEGACLPKDTAALRMFAGTAGVNNDLLVAVEKINKEMLCRQQSEIG